MDLEIIQKDMKDALNDFFKEANLEAGDSILIGGSTSEVVGKNIGSATNMGVAETIISIFIEEAKKRDLFPIIQSCEHINRALVVEREYSYLYDIMPVNAVPVETAGGGFAKAAMDSLDDPVVIEKAQRVKAGIDIGDAFIGMHLDKDRVGVVIRSEVEKIGKANLSMIRTREKLIGGDRSVHY